MQNDITIRFVSDSPAVFSLTRRQISLAFLLSEKLQGSIRKFQVDT